jgi:hypothetical protein
MRMRIITRRQRPRRELRAWLAGWLAAGAAGALGMYFLDPDRGRGRRSLARDRLGESVRRGFHALGRTGRGAAAGSHALVQQARHRHPEEWSVPNDATLAQRVRSELFRDPDLPTERITINAEAGIIVLRGEIERPDQIRAVEDAVSGMAGVRGVRNLLHLPGTPAPERGSVLPSP